MSYYRTQDDGYVTLTHLSGSCERPVMLRAFDGDRRVIAELRFTMDEWVNVLNMRIERPARIYRWNTSEPVVQHEQVFVGGREVNRPTVRPEFEFDLKPEGPKVAVSRKVMDDDLDDPDTYRNTRYGILQPHPQCGSNPERQKFDLPGHCALCVAFGHEYVHPFLACSQVGCTFEHGRFGQLALPVATSSQETDTDAN